MGEPSIYDPYLGWRTTLTVVLLVACGMSGQWWAFGGILVTAFLWKRASAPNPGLGGDAAH